MANLPIKANDAINGNFGDVYITKEQDTLLLGKVQEKRQWFSIYRLTVCKTKKVRNR